MFNTITTLWHHGLSTQWQSSKSSIHSTAAYSKFSCTIAVVSKFSLPYHPKVDYQVALYMRPVISSIMGPGIGILPSGPLRVTLPTEVVTMSKKVALVATSCITWLALIVITPRVIIIPIANGTGGVPGTSLGNSLFRQQLLPGTQE